MAKIIRKVAKIFGSSAGTNQIAKYGSLAAGSPVRYNGATADPATIQSLSNWLTGWFGASIGANSPAEEDMNAAMFVFGYQIAYLMQAGVAEWETGTTYFIGSLVQDGNGIIYTSLTDNNVGNALTSTANWAPPGGANRQKSANYTLLPTDAGVTADASAGAFTLTIPAASGLPGKFYYLASKSDTAADITLVVTGGGTIDGETSQILRAATNIVLRSDGVNWYAF